MKSIKLGRVGIEIGGDIAELAKLSEAVAAIASYVGMPVDDVYEIVEDLRFKRALAELDKIADVPVVIAEDAEFEAKT